MTARMRRLASDWEQVRKDFAGHKYIIVTPVGEEPPEKYHVTYFVNGIYLQPDGSVATLARHEVEIILHSDYPRYKPVCKILTPIWHPNFRDGQICIGDIWGAGESLTDIIVNIGDMIQYRSWNSYSPLCADAAKWAMENKHLLPVGNADLYIADYASAKDTVEIDLFDDFGEPETPAVEETVAVAQEPAPAPAPAPIPVVEEEDDGNDFDITVEELAGIEFVPTAQRMQTVNHGGTVKGGKINFKTILVKGLLWALIGAIFGFGISELTDSNLTGEVTACRLTGNNALISYYQFDARADEEFDKAYAEFERWCARKGYSSNSENAFSRWLDSGEVSSSAQAHLRNYLNYDEKADTALYNAYTYSYGSSTTRLGDAIASVTRTSTALWSAAIALFLGLFMGIGEGVFYGSKSNALKWALIGAVVSLVLGFLSGYVAQWMYSELLGDDPADIVAALVRGLGWSLMGLGIGASIGLIKPEGKRILFCSLGGLAGGFVGGFLFNYITDIIPDDIVARGVGIVIMGALIGVGVGLLEQFAKQAWLKVIRGEFEGKEYLVFAGTTSIGNNGKNTIVLFKDKLVGPHHCDIKLEGSKYILLDCGTPMGTVVNGRKIARHVLRKGDSIAIGNSVLVFNTK